MTGNSPAHRRAAVPESRHPQLGAAPATPDQLAGAWGEDEGLLLAYDSGGWIGTRAAALQNMALLGGGSSRLL